MRIITDNVSIKSVRVAIAASLVIAFSYSNDLSARKPNTNYLGAMATSDLILEVRVTALQGRCSALSCRELVYSLETTHRFFSKQKKTDAEVAIISACGKPWLGLGSQYIVILNEKKDDKPSMENSGICKYTFDEKNIYLVEEEKKIYRIYSPIIKSCGPNADGCVNIGERNEEFFSELSEFVTKSSM